MRQQIYFKLCNVKFEEFQVVFIVSSFVGNPVSIKPGKNWKNCAPIIRFHLNEEQRQNSFLILFVTRAGKDDGHEPQHFPLPCHRLAFLSSGSLKPWPLGLPCHNIWVFRQLLRFYMINSVHWNYDFQKFSRIMHLGRDELLSEWTNCTFNSLNPTNQCWTSC